MRWNLAFPNCMLQDEDAFHAMLAGIHIVDYRMRSTRFLLKGVRIPSFIGTCDLEAKLALPLLELWHTLVAFSAYAGVGIKSGLGMGVLSRSFLYRGCTISRKFRIIRGLIQIANLRVYNKGVRRYVWLFCCKHKRSAGRSSAKSCTHPGFCLFLHTAGRQKGVCCAGVFRSAGQQKIQHLCSRAVDRSVDRMEMLAYHEENG